MGGEKLHVAPLGKPEQESATGKLKGPPKSPRRTVILAAEPCFTVTDVGLTASEKSAPRPLRATLRLAELIPSVPATARVPDRVPAAEGVNVTL